MSDKEQFEKFELLSDFVDDQLPPRQVNELKRLLNNNPQMQQDLKHLQLQKQLLQMLPVESAPAEMADEIKSALERRFILDHAARHHAVGGRWRLWFRRLAATAALVLLPLFALGLVVYTIIRPTPADIAAPQTQNIAAVDNQTTHNSSPDIAAEYTPVLQFQTAQPIAVADFIEKKIHSLGLMNFTVGQRESDRASFKITCSRQYIAGLIDQMSELWPRCEKTTYALIDKASTKPLAQVARIEPSQVLEMLQTSDTSSAVQLAAAITEKNAVRPVEKSNPDAPASPLSNPIKPILAWDENNPAKEPADTQDTISVVIEVLGQ